MADAEEDSSSIACAAVAVENVDSPVQLSPNASEKQIDVESEPKKVTASVASPSSQPSKDKIDLLLKATGDAPIMKQKKWSVEADRKVGGIIQFIKKYLKLEPHDTLFLYVNQSFAPSPDQILRNLYECFGAEGKLVLHYCKTQAWG